MRQGNFAAIVCAVIWSSATNSFAHNDLKPLAPDSANAKVEAAIRNVAARFKRAQEAGAPAESLNNAQAVYWGSLTWQKHKLTVCFWNGDDELKAAVEDRAGAWSKVADIAFDFRDGKKFRTCVDRKSADIRISLDGNEKRKIFSPGDDPRGDWSQIGRQSIIEGRRNMVSMSLAMLSDLSIIDPTNFDFHVRHEFGHALGLLHEHQRELCDGWFNFQQIAADNGWSLEKAKQNVGAFPTEDLGGIVSVGPYDKNSIMQYNFALNWYVETPPETNPCERDHDIGSLSQKDAAVVRIVYGAPKKPVVAAAERATTEKTFSDLSPDELRTARLEIETQINANRLSAQSAENILKQLQGEKVETCIDIVGTNVCSTTSFGGSSDNSARLRAAAAAAIQRGEEVGSALSDLTSSLDQLSIAIENP